MYISDVVRIDITVVVLRHEPGYLGGVLYVHKGVVLPLHCVCILYTHTHRSPDIDEDVLYLYFGLDSFCQQYRNI